MKRFVMTIAAAAVLAVLALAAPAAIAGPLEDAKAAGQIGETASGYLGVVGNAPADVRRMADEINLKRREEYRAIAQKSGTSLQAVEEVLGKKLIDRARPGEYVQLQNGQWVQQR